MEEYEQHIDMKVQRGLTEEEAIADFGNVKELTAEILEAYHVRGDYASVREDTGKKRYTLMGAEKGKLRGRCETGTGYSEGGSKLSEFLCKSGKKSRRLLPQLCRKENWRKGIWRGNHGG